MKKILVLSLSLWFCLPAFGQLLVDSRDLNTEEDIIYIEVIFQRQK